MTIHLHVVVIGTEGLTALMKPVALESLKEHSLEN